MFIPSQLVIPPAKEKRPKERRYFRKRVEGDWEWRRIPRSMVRKERVLLRSPVGGCWWEGRGLGEFIFCRNSVQDFVIRISQLLLSQTLAAASPLFAGMKDFK